jgi:hypothetical protein
MRKLHPIGTKLYRPTRTHLKTFKDYECEITGYAERRHGDVTGYVLHWKRSNLRNEWSLGGVHSQMEVYQKSTSLPEELFEI